MSITLINRILFVFFILVYNCNNINSQTIKTENIQLINNFLDDLINDSIPAQTIVEKFLFVQLDKEISVQKKLTSISKFIEKAREDSKNEKNWKIVNNRVFKLNHKARKIYKYNKFKHLNKVNINLPDNEINNTYVLLDGNSKEILQYFLIKNDKIYSFNLFIQGSEAWFFDYN